MTEFRQPFDPVAAQENIKLATVGLTRAQEAPSLALTIGYMGALVRSREMADENAQLRAENAALHELSVTDPLTKLYNRRAFTDTLESLVESVNRGPLEHEPRTGEESADNTHALMIMDLDRFKRVNDTFGHEAGDEVLKTFADILRRESRQSDIAARFGGDEFALILPRVGSEAKALEIADNIRKAMEEEGKGVTASIGLRMLERGESCAELRRKTDKAQYMAKESRNQVVSTSGLKRPDETSSTDGA